MDKTKIGLIGALTSLAAAGAMSAQAAPSAPQPVSRAQSYAELLDPIPNAVERLALVTSQADPDGARLIEAQYYPNGPGYPDGPVLHHHHHHHNYYRRHWRRRYRHYHHHHHHHHHNNY